MKRSTPIEPSRSVYFEPPGKLGLDVEGKPLLGAARDLMQMAAHGPEELLGIDEAAKLGAVQDAGAHEIADLLHPIEIFADPVERMEIAQAALAFLEVRLDDIA